MKPSEIRQLKKDYAIAQKRLDKALKSLDKLEHLVDKAVTATFIAAEDMDGFAGELLEKLTLEATDGGE